MPSSNKYSTRSGNIKFSSEDKTSSRHQKFSDVVKVGLLSSRADNGMKNKEKVKTRIRHLKNSEKPGNEKKENEKDELVKHMSDLSGYLQKLDNRGISKDEALNFEVFNWNRLQNLKYPDSGLPRRNSDVSSFGKRQLPSHSSRPCSANGKGVSQNADMSRMKVIEEDFQASLRSAVNDQKPPRHINIHSSRYTSERETSLSGIRKNEVPKSDKDVTSSQRKSITNRVDLLSSSECLDKQLTSDEQKSVVLILPKNSANSTRPNIVRTSEPRLSFDEMSKEANDETLSAEVFSKEVHFEPLNVVSCSSETPTVSPQRKYIDSFALKSKSMRGNGTDFPRTLSHETTDSGALKGIVASPSRRFSFSFGKISRSLSSKEKSAVQELSSTPVVVKLEPSHRFSADEVHSSAELYPYILHACPLPTKKETKAGPSIYKAPKTQSNEDEIGQTELDALQSRHSSPNRRFGFSLGKLRRSFSIKESFFNNQHLGPEKSEVLDYPVTPRKNKDNMHRKSRPSPFRKLLAPILKTRVTYPCPSAESISSLKRNRNSLYENESLDDYSKPQETVVQALLQVTTKNGLPLFKLVVNNCSDILVAMKNISLSDKHEVDLIYTFYAVHEIKKKSSSGVNQVHKDRSYGFGYNVVGQMKGTSVNNFEDSSTQKEFVLRSVGRKQEDGEANELVPIRELASIVVKVPNEKSSNERNIGKDLTGKEFMEYLEEEKYLLGRGETEKFYKTTVILSAADHGLPKSGVPTSLIQRWRSGSCDCEGWDVGCKIQILTNEDESGQMPELSVSSSVRDHFNLFNQRGAHDSKPIFRLAPFKKGIYSIEFGSSISLLQALSICIASISSRQSFDFSEFHAEGKLLEDSTLPGGGVTQILSKAHEVSTK